MRGGRCASVPESYEEECARVTREVIKGDGDFGYFQKVLLEVLIDGVYPDTKLIVRFYDGKRGRERSQEFPLKDFGYGTEQRDSPSGVATIVAANVVVPN